MGPRHFSRGYLTSNGARGLTSTGLQWGRGISAADTYKHWDGIAEFFGLQWGRGISAADTVTLGKPVMEPHLERSSERGDRLPSRERDKTRAL